MYTTCISFHKKQNPSPIPQACRGCLQKSGDLHFWKQKDASEP